MQLGHHQKWQVMATRQQDTLGPVNWVAVGKGKVGQGEEREGWGKEKMLNVERGQLSGVAALPISNPLSQPQSTSLGPLGADGVDLLGKWRLILKSPRGVPPPCIM